MMTRSGSGRAERWAIHDGTVWWDRANQERPMMEGPESQGSMRMVYGLGGLRFGSGQGENVSRKLVSALRCLIVNDIGLVRLDD